MAKAKTPSRPDHKPPFIGQRHFNFWMAAVIAMFSVVAGYMLFVATHASTVGHAVISTVDTNQQYITSANVGVADTSSTQGCANTNYSSDTFVSCTIISQDGQGYFQITSISLPGYTVCSCSSIKVGSLVAINSVNRYYILNAGITMQANPAPSPPPSPPSPPPAPKPTPHPTPTPSPPAAGGSTSGSSTPGSGSSVAANTDGSSDNAATTSLSDTGTSANVSKDQDSRISSDDGNLTVTFPPGTFDTDAVCQINKLDSTDVPVKSSKLIGPYSIECTGPDGNELTSLNHPIGVTLRLPPKAGSYSAYEKDGKWKTVTAVTKDGELHFSLSALHLIAAAPSAINWTPVLLIGGAILLILIAAGIVVLLGQRRRGQQEAYDAYIKHRYFEGDAGARPPVSQ